MCGRGDGKWAKAQRMVVFLSKEFHVRARFEPRTPWLTFLTHCVTPIFISFSLLPKFEGGPLFNVVSGTCSSHRGVPVALFVLREQKEISLEEASLWEHDWILLFVLA